MPIENRNRGTSSLPYGRSWPLLLGQVRIRALKPDYFRPNSWFLSVVAALTLAMITCGTLTISFPQAQAQIGMKLQKVGLNPLFSAARQGDWQSVDYLLKSGSDPNVKFSEDGRTPLIMATIGRHFDIVETLLKFGARPDIIDDFGRTALSWAAELGEYEIAQLLLGVKASPNRQNKEGLTPLMMAIKASHTQLVQLLLDNNADLEILDYTGRGALDWAQMQRKQEIVRMLRQVGSMD